MWNHDVDANDGSVFIDCSSDTFEHVLNLLRGYPEPIGLTPGQRQRLDHDLQYFGGLSWSNVFQPAVLRRPLDEVGSKILSHFDVEEGTHMLRQIQVWLGSLKLRNLIYSSVRDGASPQRFHEMCDAAKKSLVLCRSGSNVFGGYAPVSWDGVDDYREAPEDDPAWLFPLKNGHGFPATQFECVKTDYAIFCSPEFGPAFGLGRDLVFWYYNTENCYANFPQSYEDTSGKGCSLFTGARLFTFDELEVFAIT